MHVMHGWTKKLILSASHRRPSFQQFRSTIRQTACFPKRTSLNRSGEGRLGTGGTHVCWAWHVQTSSLALPPVNRQTDRMTHRQTRLKTSPFRNFIMDGPKYALFKPHQRPPTDAQSGCRSHQPIGFFTN